MFGHVNVVKDALNLLCYINVVKEALDMWWFYVFHCDKVFKEKMLPESTFIDVQMDNICCYLQDLLRFQQCLRTFSVCVFIKCYEYVVIC